MIFIVVESVKSGQYTDKIVFQNIRNIKTNIHKIEKIDIMGFDVYIGKNNKQNDLLTKSANKEDMWFHTQQIHGSHVILKTEGKEVDYDTILKCASLAAKNSKAKNSNNVPVDYTFVKYVRKPNGAKPRNGCICKL